MNGLRFRGGGVGGAYGDWNFRLKGLGANAMRNNGESKGKRT